MTLLPTVETKTGILSFSVVGGYYMPDTNK